MRSRVWVAVGVSVFPGRPAEHVRGCGGGRPPPAWVAPRSWCRVARSPKHPSCHCLSSCALQHLPGGQGGQQHRRCHCRQRQAPDGAAQGGCGSKSGAGRGGQAGFRAYQVEQHAAQACVACKEAWPRAHRGAAPYTGAAGRPACWQATNWPLLCRPQCPPPPRRCRPCCRAW